MSLIPKKQSVDSVMSIFKRAIEDLEKVGNAAIREGQVQTDIIRAAEEKKALANKEANRAFAVQYKLNEILGA